MTDSTTTAGRRPSTVVGVAGTPAGRAALRWALDRSAHTVTAVAVWVPQPLALGAGVPRLPASPVPTPPLVDDVEGATRRMLDGVVADCCAATGVPEDMVDRRVESGDPVQVLLGLAEGADLLVLGNERRGAVAGALVGSVGLSCVHHATCPVVLVPAADQHENTPGSPPAG